MATGTIIHPGAPIGRLHLNNSVAAAISTGAPWRLQHMAVQDLHVLAAWIARDDGPHRPVALYGKTLMGQAARAAVPNNGVGPYPVVGMSSYRAPGGTEAAQGEMARNAWDNALWS